MNPLNHPAVYTARCKGEGPSGAGCPTLDDGHHERYAIPVAVEVDGPHAGEFVLASRYASAWQCATCAKRSWHRSKDNANG